MGEDWVEVLESSEKKQHSKLGIASCVAVFFAWGVLYFIGWFFSATAGSLRKAPASALGIEQQGTVANILICGIFFLLVLGILLGIFSLRESNSKKLFGFIGLAANLLSLCLAAIPVLFMLLLSPPG